MLFLPPGPTTIQEALELATHVRDMRITYMKAGSRPVVARQSVLEVGGAEDSDVQWVHDPLALKCLRSVTEHNRPRELPDRRSPPSTECWVCNRKGHWSRDCSMKPRNWPEFVKQLLVAHEYAEALAKEEPQHPQLPQYKELTGLVQNLASKLTDLVPEKVKSNAPGTSFVPPRSTPAGGGPSQVAQVVCKFPDGSSQVVPMPEGAYVQLANPPGLGRKGRGRAKRGGGSQSLSGNNDSQDGQGHQNRTEQSAGRGRGRGGGYRGGHHNGGRPSSGANAQTHADQATDYDQLRDEQSSTQVHSQQASNY